MSRLGLPLFVLLLATCSGEPSPDGPPPDPLVGGTLALPGCGYTVTTHDGATAPMLGANQLGPDPVPFAVHLGLAADPARSINVIWRTRDEATLATRVQFAVGAPGVPLDRGAEGVTFYYESFGHDPVRIHEAHLCDLAPDTQYSYRVGGVDADGREAWSPTYSFRTAPDMRMHPTAQVLIAVLGDTRGDYVKWGQMLQLARRLGPPDLILFTGDAVTFGSIQTEWDDFFRQGEDVLSGVPLVAAHGNHDINAVNFYAQFAQPGNEENFGLSYGPARFTVLNDSPADPADVTDRALPFLDQELRGPAPWRFVVHHRSLWSSSEHGGDPILRGVWGPAIDAHHADMVLSGHDHNYERTKPLRGEAVQPSPAQGTIYVVAGAAGAPLYESGQNPFTEKSESVYNVVLLKLRAGSLELRAYREDGSLLDSMTVMKPK